MELSSLIKKIGKTLSTRDRRLSEVKQQTADFEVA